MIRIHFCTVKQKFSLFVFIVCTVMPRYNAPRYNADRL